MSVGAIVPHPPDSFEDSSPTVPPLADSSAASFSTKESIELLCHDLSLVFKQKKYSDIELTLGDTPYIFHGHKVILAARCSFFDRIFTESESETESRIDLSKYLQTDILDPDSLDIVFRYLYNGSLDISSKTVLDVYGLCTTMKLESAENVCNSYIDRMFDSSSVCDLLLAATARKKEKLVGMCMKAIEDNTEEAMDSDEFLDLPENIVVAIVKNDNLSCTEKVLFEGILRWWCANKDIFHPGDKISQDAYLMENLLFYVRFPLMSPEELEELEKMRLIPEEFILDAFRFHACAEFNAAALQEEDQLSMSEAELYASGKFRTRARGETLGFVWNARKLGVNMSVVDEYMLTIAQPNIQKYQIGLGSKGFDHGVHFWEIELMTCTQSSHVMIGVATESVYLTQWLGQDTNGWSWFGFNGTKYNGGKSPPFANGAKFNEPGQVVGIKLDLRKDGKLCFYLDGKALGVAFSGLKVQMGKGKKLYPALSLRTSGDKVLLRTKQLKYKAQYQALLSHTDE